MASGKNKTFRVSIIDLEDRHRILDFFLVPVPAGRNIKDRAKKIALEHVKKRSICEVDERICDYVRIFEIGNEFNFAGFEFDVLPEVLRKLTINVEEVKWEMLGVDHTAIAVHNAEEWKNRYIRLGAAVVHETLDSNPDAPSSMKLIGLRWGRKLIALIEPINREKESQVSVFLNLHGDHSFQHEALAVSNLEAFVRDMILLGAQFLGPMQESEDAFGKVKQIFGRIFDGTLAPDEGCFYEFVERPRRGKAAPGQKSEDFRSTVAQEFFDQIDSSAKSGERVQFID